MSQKLQPVRGTQDYLSDISRKFRLIEETAYETSLLFGFEEIDTPIFEFSDVFHRTLGETSDAVTKETYTFKDRGGDEITLRPEGTAGIARAFISNGLAQNLPLKFYYSGPMFRYERPQKGRYRQFHQIGVECLGYDKPQSDVECIALGYLILKKLKISDKASLEINSLGDQESRSKHRALLVEFLQDFRNELSEDSKLRLEKNPLRILDSKDERDKKIIQNAPLLKSCLNSFSEDFLAQVLAGLSDLKIPYTLNDHLVRGLDYYTHTVFEFTTTHLGSQSAILAGGRYDGLIALMGGPQTSGVGWASGMERLALLIEESDLISARKIHALIPADESAITFCQKLAFDLRQENIACEILTAGNMGKRMKKADKMNATTAIIIGESELNTKAATVKNLKLGQQELISFTELKNYLRL